MRRSGRRRFGASVLAALVLLVPAAASAATSRPAAKPSPLGIFIHYGPSILLDTADGEQWIRSVWAPGYLDTVRSFHANAAAATQWVAFAKRAGATYITFTAKHHDGYALWHRTVVWDRSAGAAAVQWEVSAEDDVLAALAPACRDAGLKLYIYYSLIDWYAHTYRASKSAPYVTSMEAELTELLTRYGPVAGVWLDGIWDRPAEFWHLDELKAHIRSLQPFAAIAVNRHPPAMESEEDFATFENAFPATRSAKPQEVTFPVGRWWFYSSHDVLKPVAELRRMLARAAATRSRVLLAVPPRGDGSIDAAYLRTILAARAPARRPARPRGRRGGSG
jgi:alpha-L-fucosidase